MFLLVARTFTFASKALQSGQIFMAQKDGAVLVGFKSHHHTTMDKRVDSTIIRGNDIELLSFSYSVESFV